MNTQKPATQQNIHSVRFIEASNHPEIHCIAELEYAEANNTRALYYKYTAASVRFIEALNHLKFTEKCVILTEERTSPIFCMGFQSKVLRTYNQNNENEVMPDVIK